jgi:valyl-tRNA synthetase
MKPPMDGSISRVDYQKTVDFFDELMQLLHPFMPFVTEEIYHQLKERTDGDDLCIKQMAQPSKPTALVLTQGEKLK